MTISFVNYCLSKIIFQPAFLKNYALVIFHSYCNSNDVCKKGCNTITFCMVFTTGITAIRKLPDQLISKKYVGRGPSITALCLFITCR